MIQQSSVPESQLAGHDRRKWRVNRKLKFLRYAQDSHFTFRRHEILRPLRDNPMGLGIWVRSDKTGLEDLVWPEEVDLA